MATISKSDNPSARKPYTVRFRDSFGKQREKSFTTRTEAKAFATDQEHAKRYGSDVSLIAAKLSFVDAVETYLTNAALKNDRTRGVYAGNFRTWVATAYAGKSVKDAAADRSIAETLLNVTMLHLSVGTRRIARMLITGALDSLVAAGTIASHRLAGIKLAEKTVTEDDSEADGFVFITDAQVVALAERVGICVWLQRTMGLRVCEALGVEKSDFISGGKTLRLKWQASRDGKTRVPLKHRRAGQFRDVPVPDYVARMVAALPDGPLMPGKSTRYMTYGAAWLRFKNACKAMGVTGLTTHSLRHQFASECLEGGMNVVDLSTVLGHADPSVTLKIYVHAVPNAFERTRDMMNDRWSVKPAEPTEARKTATRRKASALPQAA